MTPKRKPLSGLARLLKSHLRLLRVHRGQIQELGELRKVILDMQPPKEFEVPPDLPPQTTYTKVGARVTFPEDPPYDWPRL